MVRLVALTDGAPPNEVADQPMGTAVVEGSPQPMESFLDTLMAGLMSISEQLQPQSRGLWNPDTALVQQQAVDELPAVRCCSYSKLVAKVPGRYVILQLST